MSLVDIFRGIGGYPVGEDTGPQYDWQRNRIATNAFSGIFDTIGSIGSQMSDAWAAREYADKVAAAQAVAYENARKINAAQKETMLMFTEFNANQMMLNSYKLNTAAINLRTALETDKTNNLRQQTATLGEVKNQQVSSGVVVGTGSAADAWNTIKDLTSRSINSSYKDGINKITQVLDKSAEQVLQADMTRWSAKERARFLDANADLRLY